jgi:hypothetical protein
MQTYLSILEDLKEEIEKPKHRSWKWLLFWRSSKPYKTKNSDPEQEGLIDQSAETEVPKGLPTLEFQRRATNSWKAEREGQVEVAKIGIYRRLLHMMRVLGRDDSKFYSLIHTSPWLTK